MSKTKITHVNLGESIQAAIDRASEGDTIIFSLSNERLIIDKSIHLVGAGMSLFGRRCGRVFYDDDGATVLPNTGDDSAGWVEVGDDAP